MGVMDCIAKCSTAEKDLCAARAELREAIEAVGGCREDLVSYDLEINLKQDSRDPKNRRCYSGGLAIVSVADGNVWFEVSSPLDSELGFEHPHQFKIPQSVLCYRGDLRKAVAERMLVRDLKELEERRKADALRKGPRMLLTRDELEIEARRLGFELRPAEPFTPGP